MKLKEQVLMIIVLWWYNTSMQNIDNNILLIIAGVVAIAVEVILGAATGFDLLILGIIAIIAGFVGIYTSFSVALIVLGVLSLVYVFYGRRFIKNTLAINTTATNVDALMGKKGTVVKKITPKHPGQIKVEGEIWRAASKDILDEGASVTIGSVSGVTLEVMK